MAAVEVRFTPLPAHVRAARLVAAAARPAGVLRSMPGPGPASRRARVCRKGGAIWKDLRLEAGWICEDRDMDQTAGPAMGDQLGRWDRLVAIARLEEISDELGMISSWLSRSGEIEDKASILIEDARKGLDTACWALSKPARIRPEGWIADGQQAANRYMS